MNFLLFIEQKPPRGNESWSSDNPFSNVQQLLLPEGSGACTACELWVVSSEKETTASVGAFDPNGTKKLDFLSSTFEGPLQSLAKQPRWFWWLRAPARF